MSQLDVAAWRQAADAARMAIRAAAEVVDGDVSVFVCDNTELRASASRENPMEFASVIAGLAARGVARFEDVPLEAVFTRKMDEFRRVEDGITVIVYGTARRVLGFYILELQRGIAFLLELHASVKRRGLGKCLLHHALTLACLQGFASVDFVVHEDNTDAQQFYLAQFCCSCDKNQRWSYDCTSWSHQSATATALALASAACKKPREWSTMDTLDIEHILDWRLRTRCP